MKRNGYTLVELAVVVFLVGIMLALGIPKVRESLINDGLKSTQRHLIGAIRELKANAVREQVDYVMDLDLNGQTFWTYGEDMTPEKRDEMRKIAFHLPEGVKITDVSQLGVEKKADGDIAIRFYKQGQVQPTVIHLAEEGRAATIVLAPFLDTLKVYDTYEDINPEGEQQE